MLIPGASQPDRTEWEVNAQAYEHGPQEHGLPPVAFCSIHINLDREVQRRH